MSATSTGYLRLVTASRRITQNISPALLNRCKRQLAAMFAIAWGFSCIAFGIGFCADFGTLTCLRVGFGVFWLTWGTALIVSTLVIADWLGKHENADS